MDCPAFNCIKMAWVAGIGKAGSKASEPLSAARRHNLGPQSIVWKALLAGKANSHSSRLLSCQAAINADWESHN